MSKQSKNAFRGFKKMEVIYKKESEKGLTEVLKVIYRGNKKIIEYPNGKKAHETTIKSIDSTTHKVHKTIKFHDSNKIQHIYYQPPFMIGLSHSDNNLKDDPIKSKENNYLIITEYCVGCRACRDVCPEDKIWMSRLLLNKTASGDTAWFIGDCSGCGECVDTCPNDSIMFK